MDDLLLPLSFFFFLAALFVFSSRSVFGARVDAREPIPWLSTLSRTILAYGHQRSGVSPTWCCLPLSLVAVNRGRILRTRYLEDPRPRLRGLVADRRADDDRKREEPPERSQPAVTSPALGLARKACLVGLALRNGARRWEEWGSGMLRYWQTNASRENSARDTCSGKREKERAAASGLGRTARFPDWIGVDRSLKSKSKESRD